MNKKNKRGRPPRNTIDKFQSKSWFHTVAHYTDEIKPFRLEKLFQPEHIKTDAIGKQFGNRNWDKYKTGDATPSDGFTSDGEPKLVELVANRIPESAYIIRHPIWEVMRLKQMNHEEVVSRIVKFPNRIKRDYFKLNSRIILESQDIKGYISSFIKNIQENTSIYISTDDNLEVSLDHLSIQLMLLRIPDYKYSNNFRRSISENIAQALGPCSKSPWLGQFYADFYDWLEQNIWEDLFDTDYPENQYLQSVKGWRRSVSNWIKPSFLKL